MIPWVYVSSHWTLKILQKNLVKFSCSDFRLFKPICMSKLTTAQWHEQQKFDNSNKYVGKINFETEENSHFHRKLAMKIGAEHEKILLWLPSSLVNTFTLLSRDLTVICKVYKVDQQNSQERCIRCTVSRVTAFTDYWFWPSLFGVTSVKALTESPLKNAQLLYYFLVWSNISLRKKW